jgi:RIO-like serine/threonine protein kinase
MNTDVRDLARRGERIGPARNLTKAEVFLVRDEGRPIVVKSVEGRPALSRLFLAGFLLRREGRALAQLRGIEGVPHLIEATGTALVVEWRPGRTLYDLRKYGIPEETGTRIRAVLAAVHARGWAHGDIGIRDILVDADGSVTLVDFATAVGPGSPPLLWRLLLPICRRRDLARAEKLVSRYREAWDKRIARKGAPRA